MKVSLFISVALACTGGFAAAQARPHTARGHSPAIGTPAGQTTGRSAGTIRAVSGGGRPHAQRTMKKGGRSVSSANAANSDRR